MKLLRGLHNPGVRSSGCVATIGNFDGVHLGHQAIIQQVIAKSKALGLPSVIVIFEPQPLELFKGTEAPARLMRFREKFQALTAFDLDYVFCLKFDRTLSGLTAEGFVKKVLVEHLGVKHLVIGDDFHFGSDRQGDFELLVKEGQSKGFTVENTPTQLDCDSKDSQRVSSTLVRRALVDAEFKQAETLLGRAYDMKGRVVHGEKLGRTLGFPTANIALHRQKSPLNGVYAVRMKMTDGGEYQGVANIGVKPTVGNFKPSLEVHLFDFSGDIYGKRVSVTFCHKVRDEKRFNGIDALKQQIAKDIDAAKAFFGSTK